MLAYTAETMLVPGAHISTRLPKLLELFLYSCWALPTLPTTITPAATAGLDP